MTRDQLASTSEPIFPLPRRRSTAHYTTETRSPPSPLLLHAAQIVERRPKKAKVHGRKYEVAASSPWVEQETSRPYTVPPPTLRNFLPPAPPRMVLPAPLQEPIVAEVEAVLPPPAPEVPAYRPQRQRRTEPIDIPRSSFQRLSPSQGSSLSTLTSSTPSRSYQSAGSAGRRRSQYSTPASSPPPPPLRTVKERKMIDEPGKGPRPWNEDMHRQKEQVVYRNSDGTRTKQYYYE